MSKDYDVSISIGTEADLSGLNQVQQALDETKNKSRAISGPSSMDAPAHGVKELTEGMKEAGKIGTDLEQSLNDVSAGAEQMGTTVSEAGADAGQSLKDTSSSSDQLGEALTKTGRKGSLAMGDVGKSATKARSRISGLRGTVVLAVNAVNELKTLGTRVSALETGYGRNGKRTSGALTGRRKSGSRKHLMPASGKRNNATPPFKARRTKPPGILTFPGNEKPLTTSTNYTASVWN